MREEEKERGRETRKKPLDLITGGPLVILVRGTPEKLEGRSQNAMKEVDRERLFFQSLAIKKIRKVGSQLEDLIKKEERGS